MTEKWNTENQLGTVIEVNEQFGRGLKVTLDSLYAPHAGKRSGKVKLDWALPTARVSSLVHILGDKIGEARLKLDWKHDCFRVRFSECRNRDFKNPSL